MKYQAIMQFMVIAAVIASALHVITRSHLRHQAKKLFTPGIRAMLALFSTRPLIGCANTYDAAVETRESTKRLTNAAAIAARHLLYYESSAGVATVATAAIPALGTIDNTETSTGVGMTVLMLGRGNTKKMVASEAMATIGVPVFQAAGGKIALTGTIQVGTLMSTASADDDVVEVDDHKPRVTGSRSLTAATTLTALESGATFFLNLAGGFTVTLPANAGKWKFSFIVGTAPTTAYILLAATADTLIGYPVASAGSDETANGNAAGDQVNFVANTALPGDRVDVECDGTSIHVRATCKATGAITITG